MLIPVLLPTLMTIINTTNKKYHIERWIEWVDAKMHGWMQRCMDAKMHGCKDAWIQRYMDGWMHGWMVEYIKG